MRALLLLLQVMVPLNEEDLRGFPYIYTHWERGLLSLRPNQPDFGEHLQWPTLFIVLHVFTSATRYDPSVAPYQLYMFMTFINIFIFGTCHIRISLL